MLDVVLRRRRQLRKRGLLCDTADTGLRVWNGNHTSPCRWKVQAGEQRTAFIAILMTSAFHDKAATGERPRSNRGTASTSNGVREIGSIGRDSIQLGQRTRNRERELRARSKAGMSRQRSMHADARTGGEAMMSAESLGKLLRAIAIFSIHDQRVC